MRTFLFLLSILILFTGCSENDTIESNGSIKFQNNSYTLSKGFIGTAVSFTEFTIHGIELYSEGINVSGDNAFGTGTRMTFVIVTENGGEIDSGTYIINDDENARINQGSSRLFIGYNTETSNSDETMQFTNGILTVIKSEDDNYALTMNAESVNGAQITMTYSGRLTGF